VHKVERARGPALAAAKARVANVKRIQRFLQKVVLVGRRAGDRPADPRVHADARVRLVERVANGPARGALVQRKDLDAADVRVLAVLVVFLDVHLHDPGAERVPVRASPAVGDGDVLPADGVGERDLGKLDEVVGSGTGVEDDVGGRVRLVVLVVDVEADRADLDAADKVDGD
jgi:hypothetical protein